MIRFFFRFLLFPLMIFYNLVTVIGMMIMVGGLCFAQFVGRIEDESYAWGDVLLEFPRECQKDWNWLWSGRRA